MKRVMGLNTHAAVLGNNPLTRGVRMKNMGKIAEWAICLTATAMLLLVLAVPANSSDEYTCYLEAQEEEILVAVWNADADDNTKNEFWRGRIEEGKQQSIQCETGRIKISTKSTEPDTAMVNKGFHDCTDGNVIGLMAD
jgi:hypothetical protein